MGDECGKSLSEILQELTGLTIESIQTVGTGDISWIINTPDGPASLDLETLKQCIASNLFQQDLSTSIPEYQDNAAALIALGPGRLWRYIDNTTVPRGIISMTY